MDDPAAAPRASVPPPPPPASAAAAEAALRAPAPPGAAAPPVSAAVAPTVAGAGGGGRQLFSVDLRPGETTIVSWKKLLKEAGLGAASPPPLPAAVPAVQPVVGPLAGPSGTVLPTENDPNDPAQPNRFNAVIEKIERLYMGKHSSDEEDLNDVPDDDQYDTEDSFIDDAELDEYFEVDNLTTKHTGYYVNKGKLERSEHGSVQNVEQYGSVHNVEPKKRRRRDSSSSYFENNQEFAQGSMPAKAPKRSALQIGNFPTTNSSPYSEYLSEGNRPVKNKSNASGKSQKMNFSDHGTGAEHASHLKISTYGEKDAPVQFDLQVKRTSNGAKKDLSNKIHRKEKYGVGQFSGLPTSSNAYSTQTMHLAANRRMEGSGIKAKGTRLERAIRDLQNIVSEYRPQTLDVHEVDPNNQAAVKRRLPQEVKQKLAKVARLSANQGKIPEDELMNRLMGIVGHLVQRRTLKRNMKEMVESGLYAKQEKADKFRQVKMEIYEMIKTHLATKPKVTEQKDDSADDFQEVFNVDERRALKGKSFMDAALEDRICDLYDLYVEGMDEDKGPQSRKLYVELADLWPQGCMDKAGIRDAISRSKERRNLLYRQRKVRNEMMMKRRRLAAAAKLRDGSPVAAQYAMAQQVILPPMEGMQPSMTSTQTAYPVVQNQSFRNADKIGETNVGAVSDGNRSSSDMKKRRLDSDALVLQANPPKVPRYGNEKQKPAKRADEAKVGTLPQMVLAIQGYDPQQPGYS